jgi:GTPase SAR1 family protein
VATLKEMSEGKEEKLRTIKLLVVGDAAVGKTTLLLSLRGRNTRQAHVLATDSVDLGDLTLEGIHYTCYDFAGQVLVLFVFALLPSLF